MSDTVIKVENLSKQYRLGMVGTGTLSHDFNRWWHKVRGKEDPYLKIGEENDRSVVGASEYVWALKNISFEVKRGEVLGIIGKNGAGKSTLLKILSRTTLPTTGNIKIKGRVASLLEVGTGFHPELSGRENIYLNGAILGMTKQEVTNKFDEIVAFAGVERYIDTPVKRYSSGMYVRLAFAVAAHLEPDILIVDEVLAVGDAEFQKKAIGKMREVSLGEGRTVLFVSHNMQSLRNLCSNGILLNNGQVIYCSNINETISQYLETDSKSDLLVENLVYKSSKFKVESILVNGKSDFTQQVTGKYFTVEVSGIIREDSYCDLEMKLKDEFGNNVACYSNFINSGNLELLRKGPFNLKRDVELPSNLNKGKFFVDIGLSYPGHESYVFGENFFTIDYSGTPTKSGRIFLANEGSGYLFLNTKQDD